MTEKTKIKFMTDGVLLKEVQKVGKTLYLCVLHFIIRVYLSVTIFFYAICNIKYQRLFSEYALHLQFHDSFISRIAFQHFMFYL